jgi:hypothetical protein
MVNKDKVQLISQLKCMVLLQKECLDLGDWDEFDKMEQQIGKLTEMIAGED